MKMFLAMQFCIIQLFPLYSRLHRLLTQFDSPYCFRVYGQDVYYIMHCQMTTYEKFYNGQKMYQSKDKILKEKNTNVSVVHCASELENISVESLPKVTKKIKSHFMSTN